LIVPAKATGLYNEYFHTLSDSLTSPTHSIGALGPQKIPQPSQIPDCAGGEYYLWHSGAGTSFSVPQLI
jgi:hypothetical protein